MGVNGALIPTSTALATCSGGRRAGGGVTDLGRFDDRGDPVGEPGVAVAFGGGEPGDRPVPGRVGLDVDLLGADGLRADVLCRGGRWRRIGAGTGSVVGPCSG